MGRFNQIRRKKIGVLTSSRADYGIYSPLFRYWKTQEWIEVERIIFGPHLLLEIKSSLDLIQKDSFGSYRVVGDFKKTNYPRDVVNSYAEIMANFSSYWGNYQYDCIFALGDRFEMSAAVQATIPFHIPIVHIHGGETTLGAIDNIYRHQISLASQLHFTSTETYRKRVAEIIGTEKNIFNVGSLSLSELHFASIKPWKEVAFLYKIPQESFILITMHPETDILTDFQNELNELYKVLKSLINRYFLVITGSNSDQNHKSIEFFFKRFCEDYPSRALYINSLGRENYFSALYNCSFVLGNSSSGIIESASFCKYAFNLGKRQTGRITNENTFTIPFESRSILKSIAELEKNGLDYRGQNIYQKKNVPQKINQHLKYFLST